MNGSGVAITCVGDFSGTNGAAYGSLLKGSQPNFPQAVAPIPVGNRIVRRRHDNRENNEVVEFRAAHQYYEIHVVAESVSCARSIVCNHAE